MGYKKFSSNIDDINNRSYALNDNSYGASAADIARDSFQPQTDNYFQTQDLDLPGADDVTDAGGFGFNQGTASIFGSGLKGIGGIMQAFAALKGIKLGRDQLGENKRQFGLNFGEQQKAVHDNRILADNQTSNPNALKIANGRTDLARYLLPESAKRFASS